MLLFIFLAVKWGQNVAEPSIQESVTRLCKSLKILDDSILKKLEELPKYEGEYLVKDLKDYNNALNQLLGFLTDHRNATLEMEHAEAFLRGGAPDYIKVNIDSDKAKLNWGWLEKGLDEVFKLRAASTSIWSRLNRMARLIPLQYYSYPENSNYTGYQSPLFPPLKEKMSNE